MKDRIAKLIKSEGLTSQQFAEITDIQSSTISHILSGRNSPSFRIIYNILENYPEVNPDWLILGKGEMYRTHETAQNRTVSEDIGEEETHLNSMDNLSEISFSDNLFTEVNNNHTPSENKDDIHLFDLSSSNEYDNHVNEKKNEGVNITEEQYKPLNNSIIAEKIIVMYSDKTFEIFNSK